MAPLEEYRRKRDPAQTSEPMPGEPAPGEPAPGAPEAGNSFVIQEHHASALHWDFRLERDGVLVSWAVPKGIPTDPKVNRLAVRVEDHPLEYGNYEGTIAHGQYGAGGVAIWDAGTYTTEKWTSREVKVTLVGQRAQGRFVLFQTGGKNWMMHRMDGPQRPDWQPLPHSLMPMTATGATLPRGRGWAYEMAWPGVRTVVRVEGGRIEATSIDATVISTRFPELRGLGEALGTTQALLDGVLVRFARDGTLDAESVDARISAGPTRARTLAAAEPVVYLAFDLVHLDGRSLVELPYRERRELLDGLRLAGPAWQVPPVFEGHGREALRLSRERGLRGVVAKRLTSRYSPGRRSPDWRVVETATRESAATA